MTGGQARTPRWWLGPSFLVPITLVFLAFPVVDLLTRPPGWGGPLLGLVGIAAFGTAAAAVVVRAAPVPGTWRGFPALVSAVVTAAVPVAPLGADWLVVAACYLGVLVPLVIPASRILVGQAVVLALLVAGAVGIGEGASALLALVGVPALFCLATGATYGLAAVSSREDLARMDVTDDVAVAERQRVAAALHEQLGAPLREIEERAAAVRACAATDAGRAVAEAAAVGEAARAARSALRLAVTELQTISLTTEARAAREVLAQSGVLTGVRVSGEQLSGRLDAHVAWIVREGTTNVLRHSGARRCEIDVVATGTGVSVCVSDDGPHVRRAAGTAPGLLFEGPGLRNLRTRVESTGGELDVSEEEGWFRLRAALPGPV